MVNRVRVRLDWSDDTINLDALSAPSTIDWLGVSVYCACEHHVESLRHALQANQSVTEVCVSFQDEVMCIADGLIRAISAATNLQTLRVDVSQCDDTLLWLPLIQDHPCLTTLEVTLHALSPNAVEQLASFAGKCSLLSELSIVFNCPYARAWEPFRELMCVTRGLRALSLHFAGRPYHGRYLDSDTLDCIIAAASRHQTLEKLSLVGFPTVRAFKKVVTALSACPRLVDVDLPLIAPARKKLNEICAINKARGGRAPGSTIKAIRGAPPPHKLSQRKAASRK